MIGTERIELIVELILWSAYIKNERPLSGLLVAAVGSGKTELLNRYGENKPHVHVLTDCTAFGIAKVLAENSGYLAKQVKHIIIPDLTNPLSRNPATVNNFITFMNALLEEGVVSIQTGFISFRGTNLRIGLLSAIPPSELKDKRHKWTRAGFMSRLLPVSYGYSFQTEAKIIKSITERQYYKEKPKIIEFPDKSQEVFLPVFLARRFIPFTREYKERGQKTSGIPEHIIVDGEDVLAEDVFADAEKVYGFRYQRQLQTLAEAHALMRGKDVVEEEDVEAIKELIPLFGLKGTAL